MTFLSELGPLVLVLGGIVLFAVFAWIVAWPIRGLYLMYFSAGILITPQLPVVREKFALPELFFLMLCAALLLNRRVLANRQPLTGEQRLSFLLLGAFVAVFVLSFAVNNSTYDLRVTGSLVETVNIVYVSIVFAAVVWLVRDWTTWLGCLLAWGCGALVVGLVGTYSVLFSPPVWAVDEFTGRISSTLKFENQVPSYLLPIVPALIVLAVDQGVGPHVRAGLLAVVAMALLTIVGTGSRTALAMLMVLFLGLAWVAKVGWRTNLFRRGLVANLGLALLASGMIYVASAILLYEGEYRLGKTPSWQRPVVMLYDWARGEARLDDTRDDQIRAVARNIGAYSVLGAGPKLAAFRIRSGGEVHNTYLAVLIESGIIGAAFFLGWLVHTGVVGLGGLRACSLPRVRLMIAACLVGLAVLWVYGLFIHGLRQRNLWMLAGLIVAVPGILRAQRSRERTESMPTAQASV